MDELKVEDVMVPLEEYATISDSCTIREALVALDRAQLGLDDDRHHHRAVLVLDGGGNIVGKLTHWAILRALEPHPFSKKARERLVHARMSPAQIEAIEEATTLAQGSLRQLCRAAANVGVRDAMIPAKESIDGRSDLGGAIFQMVQTHTQSILVTRGKTVIGILRMSDVFECVAEQVRSSSPP